MGRLLMLFYLLVGILSVIGVFIAFDARALALSQWLVLASIVNFTILYLIWKEERRRMNLNRNSTV